MLSINSGGKAFRHSSNTIINELLYIGNFFKCKRTIVLEENFYVDNKSVCKEKILVLPEAVDKMVS